MIINMHIYNVHNNTYNKHDLCVFFFTLNARILSIRDYIMYLFLPNVFNVCFVNKNYEILLQTCTLQLGCSNCLLETGTPTISSTLAETVRHFFKKSLVLSRVRSQACRQLVINLRGTFNAWLSSRSNSWLPAELLLRLSIVSTSVAVSFFPPFSCIEG